MHVDSDLPSIVVRLNGVQYAIPSRHVLSILEVPKTIPFPDSPDYVRGLFTLRDYSIPLIDMRKLLKSDSIPEILRDFHEMLSLRKQDHNNWVLALERTVQNGEPFTLATDPHHCKFGQWYYQYETTNHTLAHSLRNIERPHEELHQSAHIVLDLLNSGRKQEAEQIVKNIRDHYYPILIGLLDDMGHEYDRSFREMVLVLERNEERIGILVDEVLAVEPLRDFTERPTLRDMGEVSMVSEIAKRKADDSPVLVFDDSVLLELLKQKNVPVYS